MQEVHITKSVKMIDSPGIVAAPSNPGDVMALRSLQVEEKEESPLEAVRTLLKQCNQQHVRNTLRNHNRRFVAFRSNIDSGYFAQNFRTRMYPLS